MNRLRGLKIEGEIRESDADAWDCMAWRKKEIASVMGLLLSPASEFVSIVGPVKSGKSTLLGQLEHKLLQHNATVIRMDLLQLSGEESLRGLVALLLEQLSSKESLAELHVGYESGRTPPRSLFDLFIEAIASSAETTRLLVIFLENVDTSPSEYVSQFLSLFRSLHRERRSNTMLRRVSVVTTSVNHLHIKHGSSVSPYNVAKVLEVTDLSTQDVTEFLDQVEQNNGVVFDNDARRVLGEYTGWVPCILQSVLSMLPVQDKSTHIIFSESDIHQAICRFFESDVGFTEYFSETNLNQTSLALIHALLNNERVFRFAGDPGYKDLFLRGIVRDHSPVAFRCKIVVMLSAIRFLDPEPIKSPSEGLKLLAQLPQVRLLLADYRFVAAVLDESYRGLAKEQPKAKTNLKNTAVRETLANFQMPIDVEFNARMFRFFAGDDWKSFDVEKGIRELAFYRISRIPTTEVI
jgi:energy-coupling factor transporter ATP-binding protein EcfA2